MWLCPVLCKMGCLGESGTIPTCISMRSEPWPPIPAHRAHFCSPVLRASPFSDVQRRSQETRVGTQGQLQKACLSTAVTEQDANLCPFLGGKYYHMFLKLSHHLVCADMSPLGRVSIWLGKRFPSPSPPHLPGFPSISCRCWNKPMTDFFPTLECWSREECSRAFWPP